jgi:S-adenosylmethionine:tRNA ribosyltransferase-isomerase
VDVRDFDFDLPPELIAQEPAARGESRLLHLDRQSGRLTHGAVRDLPGILREGDLVVVNNTRVFPARLLGRRVPSGGAVEALLIGREGQVGLAAREGQERQEAQERREQIWHALMHPGQKLRPGARVVFDGSPVLRGEVLAHHFYGRRTIRLWREDNGSVDEAIETIGHVPLPPYIKRDDSPSDRERYQTIFARERGSVAAPTAGLHFTPALAAALASRGIELAEITLHVGYGTFQPVRVERVEDHRVEAERYSISSAAAGAINRAANDGRRVIAVGTTTTRTLEAAGVGNGRVAEGSGSTGLFIHPGFEFRVVRGLLTNFHLPRSSLLMLVAAFGGIEPVRAAYAAAIERRYRFYSYGDAMVVL